MATRTREELLKFIIATEGDDDIRSLAKELDKLGQTSGESADKANELLKEIESIANASADIASFTRLKASIKELGEKADIANKNVSFLEASLAKDPGNAGLERQLNRARIAADNLQKQQNSTNAEFQRTSGVLAKAGIGIGNLSQSARELETRMGAAKAQARGLAVATKDSADAAKSGVSLFNKLSGVLAGLGAYLSFRTAIAGVRNVLELGDAAEKAKIQLSALYGDQDRGNRAFDSVKKLAKETGQNFEELIKSAAKLKSFGIEPLDGSLKALINQNAKLGGSNETLQGIILAVGQAWSKQKLQGEEILQLVERGVPVWDLLSKATGKNVLELQKLSEKGQLGRDVIKQLLDEIARSSEGAAAKGLNTLSGIVTGFQQDIKDFFSEVSNAGVLDFFKGKLQQLRNEIKALSESGQLQEYAKKVADSIIGVSKVIIGLTQFIVEHAKQIAVLAAVYAGLRISQAANQFLQMAVALKASTAATIELAAAEAARGKGIGKLGNFLNTLPAVWKFSIYILAAESLVSIYDNLVKIQAVREEMAANEAAPEIARLELQREQIKVGRELQGLYAQYAGTIILDAQKLRGLTQGQAEDYRFALLQARVFFGGIIREARTAGDAQKEATATQRWKELGVAVDEAKVKIRQLGMEEKAEASKTALADAAVIRYDEMIAKAKQAREAVKGIFSGQDLASDEGVTNAIEILTQMGARGKEAQRVVSLELGAALDEVSIEKLPALQAAAEKALGKGTAGATEFADAVNRINLRKLGVDVEAIKSGFTEAGGSAVKSFGAAILEVKKLKLDAVQSSAAISQAFAGAFSKASTSNELQALKKALREALSAGSINFVDFTNSIALVDQKLQELSVKGSAAVAQVAVAATQASSAVSSIGDSAGYAASQTQNLADTAGQVTEKINETTKAQDGFTASLGEGSALFHQINEDANRFTVAGLNNFWRETINHNFEMREEQRKTLAEAANGIKKQNLQYDETEQKLVALRKQYTLLTDAELRGFIQQQEALDKNIQKAKEDADQKRQGRAQRNDISGFQSATPQSARALAGTAAERVIVVRLEVGDNSADLYHYGEDAGLERVLSALNEARKVSIRR